ncbi:MAG TPA: protein phosphatase 2C domain-containing protein [Thermoanaerobaculia bacterium]|nr:protein phosphatase 2C domain-containing protein [Thermoanaerobaculia bacterium]
MPFTAEVPAPRPAACEVHLVSACGPVRAENQDAGLAWHGDGGTVALLVADGMGGHAAGREAAQIAVRECAQALDERIPAIPWDEVLREAVERAHRSVRAARGERHRGSAMGATIALALIDAAARPARLHVVHVGDSRVYLHRGRSLYRLTADHSLVAQMVRDGLLGEAEAFGHPDGNVIQRALGQDAPLEPELAEPLALEDGDLVLVSSDGLHGLVPEPELAAALGRAGENVAAVCATLLDLALAAGGEDNVTIGCARRPSRRRAPRPTRV